MTNIPAQRRVIHVPLTDKEWKALHERSFATGSTKGEYAASAIRAALKGAKP